MSDALKKLKDLGAQKIYEDTHIPVGHVQAVLDGNYEGLTRIQFLGFLSILERDYSIDLSEERARATAHYEELNESEPLADDGIFVVPTKPKNFTPFYILFAITVFLAALYYTLDIANNTNIANTNAAQTEPFAERTIESSMPMQKQGTAGDVSLEMNTTAPSFEETVTQTKEENASAAPSSVKETQSQALEILPRSRVWLGYIDVVTNQKKQKTFTDELDLDGDKEWLLLFGHGYVDVIAGGEKQHFSEKNGLRLHYKDGMLEKISLEEFKRLNRGRKW